MSPEIQCKNYDISEIDSERNDRFSSTLTSFILGISNMLKISVNEILCLDIVGFDQLKEEILELVNHEQKLRFLIIQLTKDVTTIQVMISNVDSNQKNGSPSANVNRFTETLHQNTRQIQYTCDFLSKLRLKQQNLYVSCKTSMALIYNKIIKNWLQIRPNNEFKFLSPICSTEIESFGYEKPLTFIKLDDTITDIELVKSHIWISFASGNIQVISKAHGHIPLFKNLKLFTASQSSINKILYIPTRNGISASVWISSINEFSIWNPDTANITRKIPLDDKSDSIQYMCIVPQKGTYTVWSACQNTPEIIIWDPTVSFFFINYIL